MATRSPTKAATCGQLRTSVGSPGARSSRATVPLSSDVSHVELLNDKGAAWPLTERGCSGARALEASGLVQGSCRIHPVARSRFRFRSVHVSGPAPGRASRVDLPRGLSGSPRVGAMNDHVLSGGNSNTVVRVGETVRRVPGPWTPAVHTLLRTLRTAGVREVPEPFGFDEQGREVLSFLPGEVGNYPLPHWLWTPEILEGAGKLLRRVHDASAPLVGEVLVWNLPSQEPTEVICHNDVAPYNMTFISGRVAGLFDFDTASPGPRIWDLAYLGYRLAPLAEDAGIHISEDERLFRMGRLIRAYGMSFSRTELLSTVTARLLNLAAYTDGRLRETNNPDFAEHAAMYRRDAVRADTLARWA